MNQTDNIRPDNLQDDNLGEVLRKPPKKLGFGVILGRILLVILVTILLLVLSLVSVLFCIFRGPSPSARDLLVHSCKESSALKFVPNLFLSSEQVDSIMNSTTAAITYQPEAATVTIAESSSSVAGEADAWGLIDDDGDGIILEEVKGSSYSGYMMVVLDPSRVIVGCAYDMFGGKSYTVEEYVQKFGAVAGINGGGFEDENGMGNGTVPDSLVVFNGQFMNGYAGTKNAFTGIDSNYILHVDLQTSAEIEAAGIQWGCGYGPILIKDGEVVVPESSSSSGLNPRTAIGQRSDGAILMLVIDGRHVVSLGATYMDEAEIMLRYGAVNASNMDGGSSSLMYYNNDYVNNKAAVIGVRPIPSCWLVMPEGVTFDEKAN